MNSIEVMEARHSVRSYEAKPLSADVIGALQSEIDACNREGGLHIQLVTGEPKAFDGMMAHYGKFTGVENYIVLIGKKGSELEEAIGYYGERLVLCAQMLGLNTCWVAMTFSKATTKKHCTVARGEKLVCVLSLGYGTTQGVAHTSKPMASLSTVKDTMPEWFANGMHAAMLAPTAMNQQKFSIGLNGDTVSFESLGGFYAKTDLGIVKYHFELGSGRKID